MARIQINYPPLDAEVDELKFIGPFFKDRFRGRRVRTLRQLRDRLERMRTKEQRTQFLMDVLLNPRRNRCVGQIRRVRSSRSEEAYANEPGDYQYCVRTNNARAWHAVVTYLRSRRGGQMNARSLPRPRIPRDPRNRCQRRNYCRPLD